MPKKKDIFGTTTFVRVEVHEMGYGYNINYHELDALKEMMVDDDKGWIELELLSGSRVWVRKALISDISISTPKSRVFNQELEEAEEENNW